MKNVILIAFCFISFCCFGQFEKSTSFSTTGNFNIALKGLGYAEVGLGAGLSASFFSKHRLQAVIEAQTARFKDNLHEYDVITGEIAKTAVYTVGAGPQLCISRRIALSVTYGPCWYKALYTDYSFGYGFQYSISGFWDSKRRFITKVFMVHIPAKEPPIQYAGPIQYLGLTAGYRFW